MRTLRLAVVVCVRRELSCLLGLTNTAGSGRKVQFTPAWWLPVVGGRMVDVTE